MTETDKTMINIKIHFKWKVLIGSKELWNASNRNTKEHKKACNLILAIQNSNCAQQLGSTKIICLI